MKATRCFLVLAFFASLGATNVALAADLPARAPPPVYVPPPFSWTGFYIGGNVGGAWRQGDFTDSVFGVNFSNGNNNGVFIGGGQVGFNYQFSNIVWGVEGDFDWAANSNNSRTVVVPAGTFSATSNNRWVSTLAARLGLAYDHWLFYVKGGGGWIGNDNFTITNVNTGASFTGSNNNSNSGWLLGVGVEWAFAYNWSAKIEYDYLGLSSRSFTVPAGSPILAGDTFTTGNNNNIQMVKFGINYRFNWGGPVVANY